MVTISRRSRTFSRPKAGLAVRAVRSASGSGVTSVARCASSRSTTAGGPQTVPLIPSGASRMVPHSVVSAPRASSSRRRSSRSSSALKR